MRDGIEKLPTPDSHVDGENGAKTMVYNTKRSSKCMEEEKSRRKKERLKACMDSSWPTRRLEFNTTVKKKEL